MVTTHELLFISMLIKLICRSKICYDIQENYSLNIQHTKAFSKIFRSTIAGYVRVKETVLAPFISIFILAEQCYENELPFLKGNFVIAENKSVGFSERIYVKPTQPIKLLFSGTLDEATGVFDAIKLAKELCQVSTLELTIIGYSVRKSVQEQLFEYANKSSFIRLIGIDSLVPHQKITEAINAANFGIINYPARAHTKNRIPTKLYEYLAHQLPILYSKNANWSNLVVESQAGIAIDFNTIDAKLLLDQMQHSSFYSIKPKNVTWQSEEKRLLDALNSL